MDYCCAVVCTDPQSGRNSSLVEEKDVLISKYTMAPTIL
jgi:hypothetical protein